MIGRGKVLAGSNQRKHSSMMGAFVD